MTKGGTGDDRSNLEGLTEPSATMYDGSEDEAAGVGERSWEGKDGQGVHRDSAGDIREGGGGSC